MVLGSCKFRPATGEQQVADVTLFKHQKKTHLGLFLGQSMWKPVLIIVLASTLVFCFQLFLGTFRVNPTKVTWVEPAIERAPDVRSNLVKRLTRTTAGHADVSEFATFLLADDTGSHIAVSALSSVTGQTRLLFYSLTDSGVLVKRPEEPLLPRDLPVFVTGAFMPQRQVPQEVLYLLIVLGVRDDNGHPCGRRIVMYFFDQNPQNPEAFTWTLQPNFSLVHPLYDQGLYGNPSIPAFVAAFGNAIQGVLDDNTGGQALYVSTTDFDTLNLSSLSPGSGGGVLWFEWLTYGTNPVLQLRLLIKDAKLRTNDLGVTPIERLRDYYLLGFGSSFYVQTGRGSSNLMCIANQTDQDRRTVLCANAVNAEAPRGYVQVFRVSGRQNIGWEQVALVCDDANTVFPDRLWPNPPPDSTALSAMASSVRFGHSLHLVDNFLFVGLDEARVQIYRIESVPTAPVSLALGSRALASVDTVAVAQAGRVVQRGLLASHGLLASAVRTNQGGTAAVTVWSISQSVSQTNRFASLGDPILVLGAEDNVNSGSDPRSDTWFGRWCSIILGANQREKYLICNDPNFESRGSVLVCSLLE